MVLHQEMGQKSLIVEAPENLGTNERIVKFMEGPVEKKELIPMLTSFRTIEQTALKDPDVSPSGPGALFSFSLNITFFYLFCSGGAEKALW